MPQLSWAAVPLRAQARKSSRKGPAEAHGGGGAWISPLPTPRPGARGAARVAGPAKLALRERSLGRKRAHAAFFFAGALGRGCSLSRLLRRPAQKLLPTQLQLTRGRGAASAAPRPWFQLLRALRYGEGGRESPLISSRGSRSPPFCVRTSPPVRVLRRARSAQCSPASAGAGLAVASTPPHPTPPLLSLLQFGGPLDCEGSLPPTRSSTCPNFDLSLPLPEWVGAPMDLPGRSRCRSCRLAWLLLACCVGPFAAARRNIPRSQGKPEGTAAQLGGWLPSRSEAGDLAPSQWERSRSAVGGRQPLDSCGGGGRHFKPKPSGHTDRTPAYQRRASWNETPTALRCSFPCWINLSGVPIPPPVPFRVDSRRARRRADGFHVISITQALGRRGGGLETLSRL